MKKPTKTALIIVDVQNYFVKGMVKTLPEKISRFVKNNKKNFTTILTTQFINRKHSNFCKILNWHNCFKKKETELHPKIKALCPPSQQFTKSTYSVFKSEKLTRFLKKNNIKTVYLCGIETDACILASAFDGFDKGYTIKVIKELCGSINKRKSEKVVMDIIKKNINRM